MDSDGQPACEDCGKRLSRCKGKLHKSGAGHICQRCFNRTWRLPSTAVATPTVTAVTLGAPKRSHKRRAVSDPGEHIAAAVAAPICSSLFLHSRWATHQCRITTGTRSSRTLAVSWLALVASGELREWEEKRGGFWQHDTHQSLTCSFLDEQRVRLLHGSERLGRQLLHSLGVNSTSLRLAATKLLRSSEGEGQQEIHYDIPVYDQAARCYTVLLYLTPTLSTAVPLLSQEQLRGCFTDGEKRPSPAALHFLTRDKFDSTRVDAGDMLALRCTTAHYGDANPDDSQRYVLFMLFFPSSLAKPDTETQRYPHGVID